MSDKFTPLGNGGSFKLLDADDEAIGMKSHEGYIGAFTDNQYAGALPNGTRVRKTWEDPGGDMTKTGQLGTVMGSLGVPELVNFVYFIEWDDKPGYVTVCINTKVEKVES